MVKCIIYCQYYERNKDSHCYNQFHIQYDHIFQILLICTKCIFFMALIAVYNFMGKILHTMKNKGMLGFHIFSNLLFHFQYIQYNIMNNKMLELAWLNLYFLVYCSFNTYSRNQLNKLHMIRDKIHKYCLMNCQINHKGRQLNINCQLNKQGFSKKDKHLMFHLSK